MQVGFKGTLCKMWLFASLDIHYNNGVKTEVEKQN